MGCNRRDGCAAQETRDVAQREGTEDALPRGDFPLWKVVGDVREPGTIVVAIAYVNAESTVSSRRDPKFQVAILAFLTRRVCPATTHGQVRFVQILERRRFVALVTGGGRIRAARGKMERETGLEPATSSLEG